MSTYRDILKNFSTNDTLIKSLSDKSIKSPVYLCKYHSDHAKEYSSIKDYILNHLLSVDEKGSFELGGTLLVPCLIKYFDSAIRLLILSSDEDISIVTNESDFDKLLNDISEYTKLDF